MGKLSEHLQKAAANARFLVTIDDAYPEWLATVAFYKALHVVEAVFAHHNEHTDKHVQRNQRLKRHYREAWREYRPLYEFSRKARYGFYEISASEVHNHLIKQRLANLESYARKQIGASAYENAMKTPSSTSSSSSSNV